MRMAILGCNAKKSQRRHVHVSEDKPSFRLKIPVIADHH